MLQVLNGSDVRFSLHGLTRASRRRCCVPPDWCFSLRGFIADWSYSFYNADVFLQLLSLLWELFIIYSLTEMLVNKGLSRFKNLKVIQLTKQKQFRTSQAYNRLLNYQMLLLVLNSLYPPYWFQLLLSVMWPSGALLLSVADMAAVQLECRERLHFPAVPNCFFKGAVLLNVGWV